MLMVAQSATAIKSRAPAKPVILLTGWGYRLQAQDDVPQHVDRVLSKPQNYTSCAPRWPKLAGTPKLRAAPDRLTIPIRDPSRRRPGGANGFSGCREARQSAARFLVNPGARSLFLSLSGLGISAIWS